MSGTRGLPQKSHVPARRYTDPSWQDSANCRDVDDPDIFFITARYGEALEYCASCPVVDSCRDLGVDLGAGVWGGQVQTGPPKVTGGLRDLMPHGTEAGYARHRRAGEKACPDCLRALSNRQRNRDRKRQRGGR